MEAKRNGPRGGQQEEENAEGCQVAIMARKKKRAKTKSSQRHSSRQRQQEPGAKSSFLDFNFLRSVLMCCCHDTIPSFVHPVVDGAICRPVAARENQQAAKTDDDDADCRLRYLPCPELHAKPLDT
jgi:hypothetical protein